MSAGGGYPRPSSAAGACVSRVPCPPSRPLWVSPVSRVHRHRGSHWPLNAPGCVTPSAGLLGLRRFRCLASSCASAAREARDWVACTAAPTVTPLLGVRDDADDPVDVADDLEIEAVGAVYPAFAIDQRLPRRISLPGWRGAAGSRVARTRDRAVYRRLS